ncbi:hypothetical protein ACFQ0M_01055 [Kitasatospora aburaviensis]
MLQHLITQDEDLRMVPIDRDALVAEVARLREELAGEAGGPTRPAHGGSASAC